MERTRTSNTGVGMAEILASDAFDAFSFIKRHTRVRARTVYREKRVKRVTTLPPGAANRTASAPPAAARGRVDAGVEGRATLTGAFRSQ